MMFFLKWCCFLSFCLIKHLHLKGNLLYFLSFPIWPLAKSNVIKDDMCEECNPQCHKIHCNFVFCSFIVSLLTTKWSQLCNWNVNFKIKNTVVNHLKIFQHNIDKVEPCQLKSVKFGTTPPPKKNKSMLISAILTHFEKKPEIQVLKINRFL